MRVFLPYISAKSPPGSKNKSTARPGSFCRAGGALCSMKAFNRSRLRWRRGTGTGKENRPGRGDAANTAEAADGARPAAGAGAASSVPSRAEAAARGANRGAAGAVGLGGSRGERAGQDASHAEAGAAQDESLDRPVRDGKAEGRDANRGAAGAARDGSPDRARKTAAARRGIPAPGGRRPRPPTSGSPAPTAPEEHIFCR